ncbi:MAG: HAD family hydrolase [Planctomycetaceae bacterium]|nr:HAD family hydrolase [Planctomycetaceae bacterium]MBT4159132.1 HAD family hydrolase [Planctomycetaceae bacterium]MBT4885829.1 HAD family hydrolase [Planctomycetaceae bacterium]MBT6054232.1 HAD family hydrolase [Planctomycetaceae bacterium]MBT6460329.1 HAD family hydrolase [Planctomycetaceae bacterium]
MSQSIKLLVLDIDGTVTDSRHQVTDAARKLVQESQTAGIRVILATGRRYRDALPVATELGLRGPLVTASGALVKLPSNHETLFRSCFKKELLSQVLDCVIGFGHEPVLYTDSFHEGFDFYCRTLVSCSEDGTATGFGEYLQWNKQLARVVPTLCESLPEEIFSGFVMGSATQMEQLEVELNARFSNVLSVHTIRSPRYSDWLCEIAPAGIDKWSSVLRLAKTWGISANSICAVGDDSNDLPMIVGAGLGVAMGNARHQVQGVADHVVGGHESGGLLELVEILTNS